MDKLFIFYFVNSIVNIIILVLCIYKLLLYLRFVYFILLFKE